MNLLVFPQVASEDGGYSIVVKSDFERLGPGAKDCVVWYATDSPNEKYRPDDSIIPRPGRFALKRFSQVLSNRPSSELTASELHLPPNQKFDTVFCGDTVLYRALRKALPEAHLQVRFHNCFYRILERVKILGMHPPLKYRQLMSSMARLERLIFSDRNITPVFLCKEDQDFYESLTGRADSLLWSVQVDLAERPSNPPDSEIRYLVYFGSVDTHKKDSIDFFISKVYPGLKKHFPELEFKLYGSGTEHYQMPEKGIAGHGRYHGSDFPHAQDGLYLNPDLTGGGVKIKVKYYFENNLRFLTTPYGFEGYSRDLVDKVYCWMEPMRDWEKTIEQVMVASQKENPN